MVAPKKAEVVIPKISEHIASRLYNRKGKLDEKIKIKAKEDWETPFGQKVRLTADTNIRQVKNVETLSEAGMFGFYVYEIGCASHEKFPKVIKIGKSSSNVRDRLLNFPREHVMNTVKLLRLFLFNTAQNANNFEKAVKQQLKTSGIRTISGHEWYNGKIDVRKEILKYVDEVRQNIKKKYNSK